MSSHLRQERERRGETLRDVYQATGIPMDILAALEEQDLERLDRHGVVARYLAAYERHLGLDPLESGGVRQEELTEDYTVSEVSGDLRARRRLSVPRMVASGLVVAAIVVLGLRVFALLVDEPSPTTPQTTVPVLDQEITLRSVEPIRIEVEVDGDLAFEGVLAPRTAARFAGHDRVSVYIPDLTRVRVVHNGRTVTPLGNQSAGRRLVFIDDLDP